ncbi:MAG: hypothetical protein LCH95_20710 [Proteobacteria bacterium]|nr:hypothetical protein [Pseudomonadota bacterium]
MIAPLSLCNLLTVLVAFACYVAASRQAQGGVTRLAQLATPAILAAVVALVLLAGVIAATWQYDLEWLGGLVLGGILGHLRGWRLSLAVDAASDGVLLPAARDVRVAALGLVALAGIDFTSAYLRDAVVEPQHVAALAALFAGYLGCRALAIAARLEQRARKLSRG